MLGARRPRARRRSASSSAARRVLAVVSHRLHLLDRASRSDRSAVLMVQHLTGGAWGLVARRVLEAATRNLPLMACSSCRSRCKLPDALSWARPEAADRPRSFTTKARVPEPAVLLRCARCSTSSIWGALIFLLNKWSKRAGRAARRSCPARSTAGSACCRPRPRALRAHDHVHERRLGHVARPALVLDDLRHPDARRPGPVDDGVHDPRAGAARAVQADVAGRRRRATSTTSAS